MSAATTLHPMAVPTHGLPNWTDLHTARADRARSFYQSLLGWDYRRRPVLSAVPEPGDDGDRHPGPADEERSSALATLDGRPVAEIVGRGDCFEAKHLLSNWFPYVQVHDLEATLELVEPAGGLVLSPPASRGDEASVATILDPSDALLRIWEPAPSGPRPLLHEPGALTWIELETGDLDRARKFYGELFGWDAGEVTDPSGGQPYLIFVSDGDPVAGAVWSPLSEIPASWCTAFAVTDTDAATDQAVEAGGVVMTEPTEMAMGRQSVVVDPTGAVFGLLGPATRGPRPL